MTLISHGKLVIILATFYLFFNGVVVCQSPEEMRDAVLNSHRPGYWPDLHCVPHGWHKDFNVELTEAKTSQELIDAGVEGLYKLGKITQKCANIIEENKDRIDTSKKKDDCTKHCILRELGILKNHWYQNFSLGDVSSAGAQVKQLLSAKLYPHRMNISVELAAEIVVGYIQVNFKVHPQFFNGELLCFTGKSTDEYGDTTADYSRVVDGVNYWIGNCHSDYGDSKYFPPKLDHLLRWRTVRKEEVMNKEWLGWPDSSCLNSRYDSLDGKLWNDDWRLYKTNRDCRDIYDFSKMKIEFGEQAAAESCIKVCILEHLQAIGPADEWANTLEKRGSYRTEWVISNKEYHAEIKRDNITLLLPNWVGSPGEKDIEKYISLFYDGVTKSLADHGLAPDGAECYKAAKWNPVFRDVDMIFDKACKECKECKNRAPSAKSGSGDGGSSELWPDFSSLKGWYDTTKGDAAHPLAASRGAGVVLLKQINNRCKEQVMSPSPNQKCAKKCILEELGLITKTGIQGGAVDLTQFSTFMDGLRSVLTDKGGLATAKNMGKTLYATLMDNKITGRVTDKGCGDAGRDGWDILFMFVEDAIRKAGSGKSQNMVKPTG